MTERMGSEVQDLTFHSMRARLDLRNCRTGIDPRMLKTPEGSNTLLALILSDQCPWSSEVRIDGELAEILSGSVVDQIRGISSNAVGNLDRRFDGWLDRIPARALPEAFVNAIAYRNYSVPDPIWIDSDESRVCLTFPGQPPDAGGALNPTLLEALRRLDYGLPSIRGVEGLATQYRTS